MTKHFQRDLESVYDELLSFSAMVEEMIDQAAQALIERRHELAAKVIAADETVDRREVRIEEECLKILALHQPVAIDLRRIASVLKINNDLQELQSLMQEHSEMVVPALHCFSTSRHIERIGDHATNIAEDVLYLVAGDIVRHRRLRPTSASPS